MIRALLIATALGASHHSVPAFAGWRPTSKRSSGIANGGTFKSPFYTGKGCP